MSRRHKQVTNCLRGGPVSKSCSCHHCTLAVCSVCGAWEGSLTTDCPGAKVDYDRQQEVCETNLDYTDARGWHQSDPTERRSPRFESSATPAPRVRIDQRSVIMPTTDWARVDRTIDLEHELGQRGIAWVLADRVADDHSASLGRIEDEIEEHVRRGGTTTDEHGRELLEKHEYEKIDFRLADQRAKKCDEEFRQMARKLVAALEEGPPTTLIVTAEVVGERESEP